MKKSILVAVCLLTLCGCGKIPTLQDGKEAVVTFEKDGKEHKISAEDLYEKLKDSYGLDATVELIDTYILETEFDKDIDSIKKDVDNYYNNLKKNYKDDNEFLTEIKQNTKYSSLEAYKSALYLSFLQSHAMQEYAKAQITDDEIKEYYDKDQKEDVELYQILITPDVKDSMTSEEKKKEEDKAKEKVKEIIGKLDKADDKLKVFKSLAKENTDDESTKNNFGYMGYINYTDLGDTYKEFLDAAYKLKNGEYTKEVITTELGYHIIYRSNSKDKPSLDEAKDDIRTTLGTKYMGEHSDVYVNSLKYYRKLYNLDIVDSTLDRQYGIYMNSLVNNNTSTSTSDNSSN